MIIIMVFFSFSFFFFVSAAGVNRGSYCFCLYCTLRVTHFYIMLLNDGAIDTDDMRSRIPQIMIAQVNTPTFSPTKK